MKIWPRGFLGMLISKIAGTMTSLQRFPLKIEKFKMAAAKHVFVHKIALRYPDFNNLDVYTYVFGVKESNKTYIKTYNVHLHHKNVKKFSKITICSLGMCTLQNIIELYICHKSSYFLTFKIFYCAVLSRSTDV